MCQLQKRLKHSNLSKSPCLVNFDNLYTAQLLSSLEVIPLPLSITATAGFPLESSNNCLGKKIKIKIKEHKKKKGNPHLRKSECFYLTNLICMLRIPAFRDVADRELSINSARANAKEIREKSTY